jgi:hypothetical protein
MRLPLGINSCIPLIHGLFIRKADDKVFDAWVSFPENLDGVRSYIGVSFCYYKDDLTCITLLSQRHDFRDICHEYAAFEL